MLVKWLKTILSFNSNQNTIKMNITDANRLLSGRSEVRIPSGTHKQKWLEIGVYYLFLAFFCSVKTVKLLLLPKYLP